MAVAYKSQIRLAERKPLNLLVHFIIIPIFCSCTNQNTHIRQSFFKIDIWPLLGFGTSHLEWPIKPKTRSFATHGKYRTMCTIVNTVPAVLHNH